MGLRVAPVKLLFTAPDLITIPVDGDRQSIERESLTDDEADSMIEVKFSGYAGKGSTPANEGQSRMPDRGNSSASVYRNSS